MIGLEIKYKAKDNNARVLLNHGLFGRIIYRKYRGKTTAYYVPGMLHDTEYVRLGNGHIFVKDIEKTNELDDYLKIFGTHEMFIVKRDDVLEQQLYTGLEFWKAKADKKGLLFRERRKRNVRK